jgi:hypothetical protein
MNRNCKSLFLILCLLAFSAVHADETQTLGQQLDSAVNAIKVFSHDKKAKTLSQVEVTLNKLDVRINSLENRLDDKWDSMDQAARREARKSLQVLHKNRTEVAQWLGGMKQSTSSAWHKMKDGFSQAFSDLESSWHDAEEDIPVTTI